MEIQKRSRTRPESLMFWTIWGMLGAMLLIGMKWLGVSGGEFWAGFVWGLLGCGFSWLPVGIQHYLEDHNHRAFRDDELPTIGFIIARSIFAVVLFGTVLTATTASAVGALLGLFIDGIALVVAFVFSLSSAMLGEGND